MHDIHAATYPFIAEQLSVIALNRLAQISEKMKAVLDENRRLLLDFLQARDDLEYFWPECGTIVFPRLKNGSVEGLCKLLREQFEVSVVPGRFFDLPDHFRIGVGAATDTVNAALRQLGKGLDAYKESLSASSAEFAPAR